MTDVDALATALRGEFRQIGADWPATAGRVLAALQPGWALIDTEALVERVAQALFQATYATRLTWTGESFQGQEQLDKARRLLGLEP